MAAPSYNDFTIYSGTKLTNADWNTNLQIIVNYLTTGTTDITVGDIVCTSVTVGSSVITDLYPIGGMIEYGGDTAPTGWMICDGTAISRITYANLYAVIGIKYGVGDNSTTFNIPDYRDRVSVGKSGTRALGLTGGAETTAHGHTVNGHTHTTPNHAHTLGGHTHVVSGTTTGPSSTFGAGGGGTTTADGSHTHNTNFSSQAPNGDATNTSGSGTSGSTAPGTDSQTLSTLQPFAVANKIIKY